MEAKKKEQGIIKLTDNTILKLKITIVDIKEIGFSPFGGVNLSVNSVGGIATYSVPEELRNAIVDKPSFPSGDLPHDGWEIVDIVEQEPAIEEEIIDTSKGKFRVRVVAEAVMAARNMNYRSVLNEPVYWVNWVWKVSWKPIEAK
jgi:hypothetical protein